MDWDNLFFMIFPYISIAIAVVVTVYRSIYRPASISSPSTQLLERKKLFWGGVSFHFGISLILLAHLTAVILPKSLANWNSVPLRLYLLEATGLALGVWVLAGLIVLCWRRISDPLVRAETRSMDIVILLLLLLSVVTGILTATGYRFGSFWFTSIFSPYIASVLTLQPRIALIAPLPWVIKLHVLNFFVLLLVFPFSRLIHFITLPLAYLFRPWQIVMWVRQRNNSAERDLSI